MKYLYKIIFVFSFFVSVGLKAQIPANYSIGTWSQFKTAAVSYTFDDNCSNQLPVGLPLFDKYGFKVTFCTVTGWSPNWAKLKSAVSNGHEVASHTVDHASLNTQTIPQENTELQQSQSVILSNIPNAQCNIIAYPNCNEGDLATMQKYYIAGRVCDGQIVAKTPSDFFRIGSIITGNTGSIQKATDFNGKLASAKSSGGWCVFLTHGIDSDGGYSPTQSSEISSHLGYLNTNIADFWVATFGNVVKYIKERNAASIVETTITSDSLKVVLSHNLDKTIYNVPITIRRTLPTNWQNPQVYIGGKLATSSLPKVGNTTYIQFDAVPNTGNIFLVNASKTVTGLEEESETTSIAIEPNPFMEETMIRASGDFSYSIVSTDGRLLESGTGTNTLNVGNHLTLGVYVLSIIQGGRISIFKMIKK